MAIYTYDPGQVSVIVGTAVIGGFADGTFVKVSRASNAFDKVTGIDGIVSRKKNRDRSGEITLTLVQTSPSNDVLSLLAQADELTNSGVVPVLIKDGNGRTLVASAYAWVRKLPDVEEGKDIANRDWVLDTADLDMFVGGSEA